MPKKRIIIIENDQTLADRITKRLRKEGYEAEVVREGRDGRRRIQANPPNLVLLNVMLPDVSGTDLARQLRNDPQTTDLPIIMVAANNEENEIVGGLHAGADDFVTSPLRLSVLVARIAAVLRRANGSNDGPPGRAIHVGPIRIDEDRHEAAINGKPLALTLTEFRLLSSLADAQGRVLTRNQLIDQAIGMDALVTDRTIDVHLTSLRRKLGPARKYVKTVRGVGYQVALDDHGE